MSITVSRTFDTPAEAIAFLQGGAPVEKLLPTSEKGDYHSMKKEELQRECETRGIVVGGRVTKADLVHLLENYDEHGGGPFPEKEQEQEEATPLAAPEPEVQTDTAPSTPAVDRDGLIADVKSIYQQGLDGGVDQGLINTTIGAQLNKLGQGDKKVGELNDKDLVQFHAGFKSHIQHLIEKQQPETAGADSFL